MQHPALEDFVAGHQRLFVLTGAGCSTNSGIPDYRDSDGNWKRTRPVTIQAFLGEAATRQRYWARSMVGWRRFSLKWQAAVCTSWRQKKVNRFQSSQTEYASFDYHEN